MPSSQCLIVVFTALLVKGLLADVQGSACDSSKPLKVKDILFVVLSQNHPYHVDHANALGQTWTELLAKESFKPTDLRLILAHEHEDMRRAWAAFPLVTALDENAKTALAKWIFVVEDATQILSFRALLDELDLHDHCKPLLVGRALRDRTPSVIHHYAFGSNPSSFAYPDAAAGWLMSKPLVHRVAKRLKEQRSGASFTIDPQHELAVYIYDEFDKQEMTSVNWLCAGKTAQEAAAAGCVTNFDKNIQRCGELSLKDFFFGVKTTEMFHASRLPVLLNTWGKSLVKHSHMVLYSNVSDSSIPTVDCGVPNTERGHCGKLYAIMRDAEPRMTREKRSWLIVTDDDTLMSVPRLMTLLSCYDSSEAVAVGEVYGYGTNVGGGYPYLTGGGGFVMSLPAVRTLVDASDQGVCGCAQANSPDDMFLGMCLQSRGVPVVHRPEFHQARPEEYAAGYLERQTPVSFHRHTFHDPYAAFNTYLSDDSDAVQQNMPDELPLDAGEYEDSNHPFDDEL